MCTYSVHNLLLLHVVFQKKLPFFLWKFSSKLVAHEIYISHELEYSVPILICMHVYWLAALTYVSF